jgi:hypothetical protein
MAFLLNHFDPSCSECRKLSFGCGRHDNSFTNPIIERSKQMYELSEKERSIGLAKRIQDLEQRVRTLEIVVFPETIKVGDIFVSSRT